MITRDNNDMATGRITDVAQKTVVQFLSAIARRGGIKYITRNNKQVNLFSANRGYEPI
jgi:hypothetical protein